MQEDGQALVLALFQHLWLSEHLLIRHTATDSMQGSEATAGDSLRGVYLYKLYHAMISECLTDKRVWEQCA